MSQRAIGVFDSGVGGLTVMHELMRHLPQESLHYLGDTARVPYGTKSAPTVQRYALEAANFLVGREAKALVVACNTASAVALQLLEDRFQLPVVGVIEPGALRASQVTISGRVGVIGTEGTIASGAYTRAIQRHRADAVVHGVACPLFVPLVEEGWREHAVAEMVARDYLQPLLDEGIDTLVLGCTHYPLLKEVFSKILGPAVQLVDSAEETAQTLMRMLDQGQLRSAHESPVYQFYVTDVPDRFTRVGGAFLGEPLTHVQQIRLD